MVGRVLNVHQLFAICTELPLSLSPSHSVVFSHTQVGHSFGELLAYCAFPLCGRQYSHDYCHTIARTLLPSYSATSLLPAPLAAIQIVILAFVSDISLYAVGSVWLIQLCNVYVCVCVLVCESANAIEVWRAHTLIIHLYAHLARIQSRFSLAVFPISPASPSNPPAT